MPYKDEGVQKEAQRQYYLANKGKYAERVKRYKQVNLDYVRQVKESNPCADCDKTYPYAVMEFHHHNDDKEFEINHMLRGTYSLKRIKAEIDKCILLCANCHRIRTYHMVG